MLARGHGAGWYDGGMTPRRRYVVRCGAPGVLTLPPELAAALGVADGEEVEGEAAPGELRLRETAAARPGESVDDPWEALRLFRASLPPAPHLTDEELEAEIRRAHQEAADADWERFVREKA